MSAKFGPAGNSDAFSAVHKSSLAAPQWIAEQGLDCYEYQCGKGVHVGEDTARRVGRTPGSTGSPSLSMPLISSIWPTRTRTACKRPSAISPPPAWWPVRWGPPGL